MSQNKNPADVAPVPLDLPSTQHQQTLAVIADLSAQHLQTLAVISDLSKRLTDRFDRLEGHVSDMRSILGRFEQRIEGLEYRVERQQLSLNSLQSFPMPPIKRPAQLYATRAHSVSHPEVVPVGYTG